MLESIDGVLYELSLFSGIYSSSERSHRADKPKETTKINYVKGIKHGKIIKIENGKVTMRGSYESGKKIGEWTYYSPKTSKMIRREQYTSNCLNGVLEVWDEKSGNLQEKTLYSFGAVVYREKYNNDGTFFV